MNGPTYQGIRRRTDDEVRELLERARRDAPADAEVIAAVETFCFFVGYARSGHTALAAILDAHPDAVVSNELDILGFLDAGFGRAELLHMVLSNAHETAEAGNAWTGYDYAVPGGWQGRARTARVMGDKKAGVSAQWLAKQPELLQKLRAELGVPLRVLHVMRNPYDHLVARMRARANDGVDVPMTELIARHLPHYDRTASVRAHVSDDEWLDLRTEDLVARPEQVLREVLAFVGLDADDEFVEAAAGIVMASPNRRRDTHAWLAEERSAVEAAIERHEFLRGYSFDD